MADELHLSDLAKVSKLFEALSDAGRKKLLSLSRKVHFDAGAVVCREGEEGDEFFVIAKGQVKVTVDDLGTEKEIATLGPGQFFGEQAVLSGKRRQATVTAVGPVELVGFPRSAVDALLQEFPAAREVLNKVGLLRAEDTMNKMMG